MNVLPTRLPGVVVLEPRVFRDDRGHFFEVWNGPRHAEAGLPAAAAQDNLSCSGPNVLRGLHLQHPAAQSKLITVLSGAIWDVAVDVRHGSPTFGQWVSVPLAAEPCRQLFIPAGFAHGFVVMGAGATVLYKCDAPYCPSDELTVRWDDPDLAIPWPVAAPVLSAKDRAGLRLRDIPAERLPRFTA